MCSVYGSHVGFGGGAFGVGLFDFFSFLLGVISSLALIIHSTDLG